MTYKIPDKDTILRLILESPAPLTKREIVAAFDVKSDDRRIIKDILRDLENEGAIVKQPGQEYAAPQGLPSVVVAEVYEIDIDGDVFARPLEWNDALGERPRIEIVPDDKKGHPSLKEQDRALVRVKRISDKLYEGHVIKKLDADVDEVLGLVIKHKRGYVLLPTV